MTLEIGLVGCGRVCADHHLPALTEVEGLEVVGLADVDPGRLNEVADRFAVSQRFTDHLRLLEEPSIDVVGICAPVGAHLEIALAALEAGKHVFVEKPVALSVEGAEAMAVRAAAVGRQVMVGHNLRFHRLVGPTRTLLEQGRLGRVDTVQTVWTTDMALRADLPAWRRERATGGGVLFEMAVHHFELVAYLLGEPISEVSALGRDGGSEDCGAVVLARTRSGVLVSCSFSQESVIQNAIRINGEAGHLELDLYRFDGLRVWSAGESAGDPKTRLRQLVETVRQLPTGVRVARSGGDYLASYAAEWSAFRQSIVDDGPSPCTVAEGASAVEVALAAIAAIQEGRTIGISPRRASLTATQEPARH